MMHLPRLLDPVEARVLGVLMEKEQTTPEYYPLTLKAVVAACNQRSNRNPVMQLDEADVRETLDRLHSEVLVWPVQGARSERWRHSLDRRWELSDGTKAILTLLLLRGPQTPGELRNRSERLYSFSSPTDVEQLLESLAGDADPLVVRLSRQPGQKESRWSHLACGPIEEEEPTAIPTAPAPGSMAQRVSKLEARVDELERLIAELTS
jgi:uncharacterized protein YceH (UPF0502 family)